MTRKAVETGALWKPWKNGDIKQTTLGVEFFHRSHNASTTRYTHRRMKLQDSKSVTYVPGRNCCL